MKYVKGNATITAEVLGNEVMVITTVKGVETDSKIYGDVEWNTVLTTLKGIGFKEVKVAEKKTSAPKTEEQKKAEREERKAAADAKKTEKYGSYEHRCRFIEIRNATCCKASEYFDNKMKAVGKYAPRNPEYKKQRRTFVNAWANRLLAEEEKAAEQNQK